MRHRNLLLFLLTGLIAACLSLPASQSIASENTPTQHFDLSTFSTLPILHEGRIKPMDSFAKALLKKLSGKDTHAMNWLTETLFNPAFAENMRVIKIGNPDVLNMLEIPRHKSRLYTHAETKDALFKHKDILASVLSMPEQKWSAPQRELVKLSDKNLLLSDLLASMTLFLPLSIALPDDLPDEYSYLTNQSLTYIDLLKHSRELQTDVAAIVQSKGEDISTYSDTEQKLAFLSFSLENIRLAAEGSLLFKVVPMPDRQEQLSPWDIVLSGQGHPRSAAHFKFWQKLAQAYHGQDFTLWAKTITELEKAMNNDISPTVLRHEAKSLETLYNQYRPMHLSLLFYSLAIITLIAFSFMKSLPAAGIKTAATLISMGAVIHMIAIGCRMYILMRPPVSTLYESIIFVGLITVIYGLLMFLKHKEPFWLYLSTITGIFIHVLGLSHDQDGDSMMMLTAVLNTNFWLATHVICITIGYAFCLITSGIAHYALYQHTYHPDKTTDIKNIFSHTHKAALLALLFSAVGTVLGGIWADQSWGRFWGWDPKENGALLIVLWLVWVLHGRISGQMKQLTTLAGLAYLSVIVALSWFGVNLLGVGLHAYGFTDSAAWGLLTFTGFETALIAGFVYKARKRQQIRSKQYVP